MPGLWWRTTIRAPVFPGLDRDPDGPPLSELQRIGQRIVDDFGYGYGVPPAEQLVRLLNDHISGQSVRGATSDGVAPHRPQINESRLNDRSTGDLELDDSADHAIDFRNSVPGILNAAGAGSRRDAPTLLFRGCGRTSAPALSSRAFRERRGSSHAQSLSVSDSSCDFGSTMSGPSPPAGFFWHRRQIGKQRIARSDARSERRSAGIVSGTTVGRCTGFRRWAMSGLDLA